MGRLPAAFLAAVRNGFFLAPEKPASEQIVRSEKARAALRDGRFFSHLLFLPHFC